MSLAEERAGARVDAGPPGEEWSPGGSLTTSPSVSLLSLGSFLSISSPVPQLTASRSVCTPYQAPAKASMPAVSDEDLIRKYLPNFGYQLYFKTPEAVEEMGEVRTPLSFANATHPLAPQVIDLFLQPMHSPAYRRLETQNKRPEGEMGHWVKEGRLQASILKMRDARRAGTLPPPPPERVRPLSSSSLLSLTPTLTQELDYYISQYKKSGMRGPLSWYRTRSTNFREEQEANLPPFPTHIPALQLPAANDAALPPAMCLAPAVLGCFPAGNLEVRVLDGADHWCLQVRLLSLSLW